MQELLIVAGAHLLAVISPGPDLAVVLRSSIVNGRKPAIFVSLGIALGIMIHVAYSMIGLGLIVSQSIMLFNVIKFAGAAYLIWIGLKTLRSVVSSDAEETPQVSVSTSNGASFKQGFLTNMLNPKATLFFLSLFTQVVNPDTSDSVKILYGLEMTVVTFLWFALVASFFAQQSVRRVYQRIKKWIDGFFGAVLVLLGIKVAT